MQQQRCDEEMKVGEQPAHFRHQQFWAEKKAQYPPDHRTQIIGAHFNFIGFYSSSLENKENILLEKPSRRKLRQQQERMTSTSLWKTPIFQGRINTLSAQERNLWYLLSETKVESWLNSDVLKQTSSGSGCTH